MAAEVGGEAKGSAASVIRQALWLVPLAGALVFAAWWLPPRQAPEPGTAPPAWADESSCRACHSREAEAWQASHHSLAMQPATEATVRGAFDGRSLETDVETSRFLHEDGALRIRTPGPDGELADYPVAYAFGFDPLQQYLLRLPNGGLQAHGAAWDVPGQRWFHLYDGDAVDSSHPLHWSGSQQNADFMCIECHATGFQRQYDPAKDRYASRWHAPGVGCQSCHGPAAGHLRWAEGGGQGGDAAGFEPGPGRGVEPRQQVQSCARCHSRRTPLGEGDHRGADLLDDYLPMVLGEGLYEVDGKIRGEVFEYGSFVQSRMHAVGVICTDCHDPHSGGLHRQGNAVCSQCHSQAARPARVGIEGDGLQAKAYDDPSHHRHETASPGSRCVDCHMPGKIYMGNDLRHDHGFTSPHPRQALALSHSDACLGCHGEGETEKVLQGFDRWFPGAQPRDGGYASDLHAARSGAPGAAAALLRQLGREDLPDIRRATLLIELLNYPSEAAARALIEALRHRSPLVRHSAVQAVGASLPAPLQAPALTPLLRDPVRAVRLAASWQLVQLPPLPASDPRLRLGWIAEYEESQETMLERAESHFNLAGLYQATGRDELVVPALRRALQQDSAFFPAWILLAQWLEGPERDPEGAFALLDEAIGRYPTEASLRHALGLMQVRQGRREQALTSLSRAVSLAPDQLEFVFVLAVALHDGGRETEALGLLRQTLHRHPADRALRLALVGYLRAAALHVEAEVLLDELAAQNPGDPSLQGRSKAN